MIWTAATLGLAVALVPCGVLALSARGVFDRLVALEMGAIIEVMLLVTLAEALQRPLFLDLALALALLSFGGSIVFTRFLERWL